jgi:predicted lipoprotein with Yx(FWY)xxD motif/plastocyanin
MRPNRPTATLRASGLLAGIAILVAACSAGSTPSAAASAAASAGASASAAASGAVAVDATQSATLGAYLTGANGMTLYVFKKDSGGTSACTGSCATTWPPLTEAAGSTVTAGSGVTGTFASITRDDGSTQVTYDGAPLYYYKGDQKAGDTNGQGLNGFWFVATPSGQTGAAPSPSPSTGASGGGGYGGGYGGSVAAPSPSAASGTSASIVDFGFQPASLTVKAGTTVTWTNTGAVAHTVTASDGSFDSGHVAPGATFQHTFATAGTFTFHCAIHASMTGTVVVTG